MLISFLCLNLFIELGVVYSFIPFMFFKNESTLVPANDEVYILILSCLSASISFALFGLLEILDISVFQMFRDKQ